MADWKPGMDVIDALIMSNRVTGDEAGALRAAWKVLKALKVGDRDYEGNCPVIGEAYIGYLMELGLVSEEQLERLKKCIDAKRKTADRMP